MFVLDTMGNSLKSILFFKREGKKKRRKEAKRGRKKKKDISKLPRTLNAGGYQLSMCQVFK